MNRAASLRGPGPRRRPPFVSSARQPAGVPSAQRPIRGAGAGAQASGEGDPCAPRVSAARRRRPCQPHPCRARAGWEQGPGRGRSLSVPALALGQLAVVRAGGGAGGPSAALRAPAPPLLLLGPRCPALRALRGEARPARTRSMAVEDEGLRVFQSVKIKIGECPPERRVRPPPDPVLSRARLPSPDARWGPRRRRPPGAARSPENGWSGAAAPPQLPASPGFGLGRAGSGGTRLPASPLRPERPRSLAAAEEVGSLRRGTSVRVCAPACAPERVPRVFAGVRAPGAVWASSLQVSNPLTSGSRHLFPRCAQKLPFRGMWRLLHASPQGREARARCCCCVRASVAVCARLCVPVWVHVFVCPCVGACVCACVCGCMCGCVFVCRCMCARACICVCACVHTCVLVGRSG